MGTLVLDPPEDLVRRRSGFSRRISDRGPLPIGGVIAAGVQDTAISSGVIRVTADPAGDFSRRELELTLADQAV